MWKPWRRKPKPYTFRVAPEAEESLARYMAAEGKTREEAIATFAEAIEQAVGRPISREEHR